MSCVHRDRGADRRQRDLGGGLAALAMKKLRGTTGAGEAEPTTQTRQLDFEKEE